MLRGFGAVALVLGLLAGTSPTLPLPPPSTPSISPSSEVGKVHLSSVRGAEPNALVIVYNRNPAVPLNQRIGGAQADGEGTWDADVVASSGDVLDITQEFGSTRSPATT